LLKKDLGFYGQSSDSRAIMSEFQISRIQPEQISHRDPALKGLALGRGKTGSDEMLLLLENPEP
jgi:hypothetical protein